MSYAILRIEKIKSPGAIGKHIDRGYEGQEHTPENADPERTRLNIHWNHKGEFFNQKNWLEFTRKNSLIRRIQDRLSEGYQQSKAIRKDAVKALEYLFASEHSTMVRIVENPELFREWMTLNKKFLSEIHGEENILSMSCHMDELTPHVHAVVVPLTQDGRLSARDFVNGGKQLSELQTRYAELMSKFGMSRGQVGSRRIHEPSSREHLNRHFSR